MDDAKLDRLLLALRGRVVDTKRIEHGFETRMMAVLRHRQAGEPGVFFMAWKLAPMFLALLLAVGGWVYTVAGQQGSVHIAAIGAGHEEVQMVRYMTGD